MAKATKKQVKKKEAELEDVDLELDGAESDAESVDAAPPAPAPDAEPETPQSRARKAEAAAKKAASKNPPVTKEWYEWKREKTYNEKKGLKLVRVRVTRNGGQSDLVGYEKKIPKSFIAKIKAEGKLKE